MPDHHITLLCPSCGGADRACETCGNTRAIRVPLSQAPKMPTTPCCGASWDANPDAAKWACSQCGTPCNRREVVGW